MPKGLKANETKERPMTMIGYARVSTLDQDLSLQLAAGIAAAKARGVYKGRPSTIDAEAIQRLRDESVGPCRFPASGPRTRPHAVFRACDAIGSF